MDYDGRFPWLLIGIVVDASLLLEGCGKIDEEDLVLVPSATSDYEFKNMMEAVMQSRKKKIVFMGVIIILLLGMFGRGIIIYMKRTTDSRMIRGNMTDYTYYDRKLTAEDFLQFDYDTTYEEMVECIGEENGRWGSGGAYPYYELRDGTYAICNCLPGDTMRAIFIVDRKKNLYSLLKAEELEN